MAQALAKQAEYLLQKFQPMVVGVTGSVGKTITKEAIFTVLSQKQETRRNQGNYNNEIGVPLSVIGLKKPEGVVDWLGFLTKLEKKVKEQKNFPAYLVLEMGAEQRGDIKKLCQLIKPTIGVVTTVGYSHLEYFKTLNNLIKEKRTLVEFLPKNGWAVLNFDDPGVLKMKTKTKAKILTYGLKDGADVKAANVSFDFAGTSFKLIYKGSVIPVRLNNLGYSYVKASLAAVAVGLAVGMDIIDIVDSLAKMAKVPGRMNIVEGEKGMIILDDAYNASSPVAMFSAFDTIRSMRIKNRKMAILGSMWELGKEEEKGHVAVGKMAGNIFDELVLVEKNAALYLKGVMQSRMPREKVHVFATTDDMLAQINGLIRSGDFIFVKGSRSKNHLEKVVKLLMKEKTQAEKFLVEHGKD